MHSKDWYYLIMAQAELIERVNKVTKELHHQDLKDLRDLQKATFEQMMKIFNNLAGEEMMTNYSNLESITR